jgi:hypothetical protein
MVRLIKICEEYARKWKIEFNPKKSVSVTFNNKGETERYMFKMCEDNIPCVNGFIYLGLPIGNNEFIDTFLEEAFKRMQRSVYSLYGIGFKPKLVCPQTVAFVFKQYCQSSFRYCLDNVKIPYKKINELDVRQNTLLKNAIGLSKFVRTTPLFRCLRVETIKQLYQKRKVSFISQIKQNEVCKYVYTFLRNKYTKDMQFKKNNKSFIKQIFQIENELRIDIDEYDNEVILMLLEIKLDVPGVEVLESVNKVLFNIKIRMKNGREYFFLYKNLSDILSYK